MTISSNLNSEQTENPGPPVNGNGERRNSSPSHVDVRPRIPLRYPQGLADSLLPQERIHRRFLVPSQSNITREEMLMTAPRSRPASFGLAYELPVRDELELEGNQQ